METKIVCQGDIESLRPVVLGDLQEALDGLRLAAPTLFEQRGTPAIGEHIGLVDKLLAARDSGKSIVHLMGIGNELRKVVLVLGITQYALGDMFATRIDGRFVVLANDMQDDIVVGRIGVMVMATPVGRTHMDLHIAHPLLLADTQVRMAEVGSRIAVVFAYRQHLNGQTVGGLLVELRPQALLPYVVQEDFGHFFCLVNGAGRLLFRV